MVAEDMYIFSADGKVLSAPAAKPWPSKPPKCTDCAPLFMKVSECSLHFNFRWRHVSICFDLKTLAFFCILKAYQMRGAGAVIHSIASMLEPGAKEFRVIALCPSLVFCLLLPCETRCGLNQIFISVPTSKGFKGPRHLFAGMDSLK